MLTSTLQAQAPAPPGQRAQGRASMDAASGALQAPPAPGQVPAAPRALAPHPRPAAHLDNNALPFPRLTLPSGPSLLATNLRKLGQLVPPQLPLLGGAAPGAAWGRAAEVLQVSDAAGLQVGRVDV